MAWLTKRVLVRQPGEIDGRAYGPGEVPDEIAALIDNPNVIGSEPVPDDSDEIAQAAKAAKTAAVVAKKKAALTDKKRKAAAAKQADLTAAAEQAAMKAAQSAKE